MLLNGTITIKPAPQNGNPAAKAELVTIEYHGFDGKYYSATRHAYKLELGIAINELLDILYAESNIAGWTAKQL